MGQPNFLLITSAIFGLASFFLFLFFQLFGQTKAHKIWSFFNLFVAWWGIGLVMVCLSQAPGDVDFWWSFSTSGGLLIPPTFFYFTTEFLRLKKLRWLVVVFFIQALVVGTLYCLKLIHCDYVHLYESFYYPRSVDWTYLLVAASWLAPLAVGHALLYRGLKGANPEQRGQILYLLFGFMVGFVSGGVTHFFNVYAVQVHPSWNIFIAVYVLIISYAIFKRRMFSIDLAIRKGVTYAISVGAVSGIYVLSVILIERGFRSAIERVSVMQSILIIVIILLISEPLRHLIQSMIDRRFFRGSLVQLADQNEKFQKVAMDSDRSKAVGILAAGMAHEIKNPLTVIQTFAEYLPQKYDDPEFREKFSRMIPQEIARMKNIVSDLLAFSRPSEPKRTRFEIDPLLRGLSELVSSEASKSRVRIRFTESGLAVFADPEQIKQAVLNIMMNAVDAMKVGGGEMRVYAAEASGKVRIHVQDTGAGIAQDKLTHIFDPFYTDKDHGTGLGLAVTYSIVQKNAGSIYVKSEPGRGTEFAVELPVNGDGK